MEKEYEIPKTVARLEQWMRDRNYHFRNYAIGGNSIYEGFGIDEMVDGFAWYFAEKGQKDILQIFGKEEDIVAHAFKEIKFDKWGNNYCIGFTESIDRASELCAVLVRMKIVFTRDQIPYFGPKRPVFRVFVYGWDVLKTKELQAKYYEVK